MGYCACYKGEITLKPMTKEDTLRLMHTLTDAPIVNINTEKDWRAAIEVVLDEAPFYDRPAADIRFSDSHALVSIKLDGYENYHEKYVKSWMKDLAPYVKDGLCEYIGDDDTRWQHRFKDGRCYEDIGFVVYDEDDKNLIS